MPHLATVRSECLTPDVCQAAPAYQALGTLGADRSGIARAGLQEVVDRFGATQLLNEPRRDVLYDGRCVAMGGRRCAVCATHNGQRSRCVDIRSGGMASQDGAVVRPLDDQVVAADVLDLHALGVDQDHFVETELRAIRDRHGDIAGRGSQVAGDVLPGIQHRLAGNAHPLVVNADQLTDADRSDESVTCNAGRRTYEATRVHPGRQPATSSLR
jgi:hypothetical protein